MILSYVHVHVFFLSCGAVGVKTLQKAEVQNVSIDSLGNAEGPIIDIIYTCIYFDCIHIMVIACAEGSVLGTFSFDKLKNEEKRKKPLKIKLIR